MKYKYLVKANLEGVNDFLIDETFSTRYYAMKAVRSALKAGLIVRVFRLEGKRR